MSEWFETLDGLHDRMWQRLSRGVADRKSPARQPTFATVSADGWPEARTVVLRTAQRDTATVEVYTDLHSDKITSLRTTPRAALHIWEDKQHLQIRLQCAVTILTGDAVRDRWNPIPERGRMSYGVTPAPGTPLGDDALAYDKDPDFATFAVLSCAIQRIDLVHLGDDHRRAAYARADGWQGQWLSP
ncbi:Pyridoxamine 5'-phosphate oxidase [Loktanella sp. DSM 29012]|uniref:pyridoxamine 5'-phosphate oxidase family protein n=1 Tax=Loktanella sp. DSM 29012 TaxID=1881056 RepID=UPI0008BBEFD8|nr:pyridoxamine 5'-phosphate oxidase family protein [Loktanella sp. DSM 29012]SEP63345.1 Pyridoxamine 5'-phosphate oxidase [Loktanella sp. DSM 29012]